MKRITKEIEVKIYNKKCTIEVEFCGRLEKNYGADADGNRGMDRWDTNRVSYEMPDRCDDGYPMPEHGKQLIVDAIDDIDIDWESV